MHSPYIVVGVGRSGTSTVAGILHNVFNIKMADKFVPPDTNNVEGHWEDMEFRDLNYVRLQNVITKDEWETATRRLIRKKRNNPWGFKDPRTSIYLKDYLNIFDAPKIIYCSRDKELVINSLKRCYGFSTEQADKMYNERVNAIESALDGVEHLRIHFEEERILDSWIVDKISKHFNIMPYKQPETKDIRESVYIAIINQGWIRPELNNYLMSLYQTGIPFKITYPNLKPASHNRNVAVQNFLKSNYTHFMCIDHDVVPEKQPLDFIKSDKKIIGFPAKVYQKGYFHWVVYDKDPNNFPYYNALDIDGMKNKHGASGLLKCDVVGSGCMLIHRDVLEKIQAPFSREWNEDGTQKFGLDFAFCRKAEKLGIDVHCAIDYTCEHHKEFGLNKFTSLIYG